jgi:hypothetical protein
MKVISIVSYVIAGLFLFAACFSTFFVARMPASPGYLKFVLPGIQCIPAVIALGFGLVCTRFRNWRRDVGIVAVSAAGFAMFQALTMVCMFASPEMKEFFPDGKTPQCCWCSGRCSQTKDFSMDKVRGTFLSGCIVGVGCTAVLGGMGVLLIRASKKRSTAVQQADDAGQPKI